MDEKAQAERQGQETIQAADRERVDLELRLQQMGEALREAEAKTNTLQAEMDAVVTWGASSNKSRVFSSANDIAGIGSADDVGRNAVGQQAVIQASGAINLEDGETRAFASDERIMIP